ncbi:MAG: thiamine phosphate synthase, partial [Thiohalomonadaceae bacterium]
MSRLRGLYVITDTRLIPDEQLTAAVEQAIAGGAQVVQYRDKRDDASHRDVQAEALANLCRAHGAVFIVNDDPALAAAVQA